MKPGVSFLVAEDDGGVGRALVRALAPHGPTVLVSSNTDARRALAAHSFGAIVADIGLPDGSGFHLIAEARERHPTIAALVVSGHVDERRLAEAHRLGAHYLLKPTDVEQLGLFALRARAKSARLAAKSKVALERWAKQYHLTLAESGVLGLAVDGVPRHELANERRVKANTIKQQVQMVLEKTGDASLDEAVKRLLREVINET